MAALNKSLLSDTSRLINAYLNPKLQTILQEQIRKNPRITYRGRPMYVYIQITLAAMNVQDWKFAKRFYKGKGTQSESVISFFELIDTNQGVRSRTLKSLTNPQGIGENQRVLSKEQINAINKIEKKAKGKERKLTESYQKTEILEVKKEELASPENIFASSAAIREASGDVFTRSAKIREENVVTKSGFIIDASSALKETGSLASQAINSGTVKNLVSGGQIAARKFIARHPTVMASGFGAVIGGITGYGVAGPGGGIAGVGLGLAAPSVAPKFFSVGGTNLLGGGLRGITKGGGLALKGAKVAGGPVGWALLAKDILKSKKIRNTIIWVVVAVVIGIPLMGYAANLEKTTALLPPYEVDTNVEPTGTPPPSPTGIPIPGLELTKTGPDAVNNGENIKFTITAKYSGSGDIEIKDEINSSDGEILIDTITGTTKSANSNTVIWGLKGNSPNENGEYIFEFTAKPLRSDFYFKNKVVATDLTSYNNSDIAKILPDTEQTELTIQKQKAVADLLRRPNIIQNISIYQEASRQTGVAWEILAGIHYREGGMGPNSSLASGRPIGQVEPDVRDCEEEYQPGKPYRVGNGCVFKNLLDTAIYAGDHFKGKNGGVTPSTLEELVGALSRYNGGGNANCGKLPTPYTGCPSLYFGEDDPYAVNLLDKKHEKMYVIYCRDYRPGVDDGICPGGYRPDPDNVGVLSAIMGIVKYFNQN